MYCFVFCTFNSCHRRARRYIIDTYNWNRFYVLQLLFLSPKVSFVTYYILINILINYRSQIHFSTRISTIITLLTPLTNPLTNWHWPWRWWWSLSIGCQLDTFSLCNGNTFGARSRIFIIYHQSALNYAYLFGMPATIWVAIMVVRIAMG